MAKRGEKKQTAADKPQLLGVGSAAVSEIVERWSDGDTVLFDCVLFKCIQVHGLTGRFNDKDEFWISFPARKGADGKYYKHLYCIFTPEALEYIKNTLYKE